MGSIRGLGAVVAIGMSVLVATMLIAFVWSAERIERAVAAAARDTESRWVASELEVDLLRYQRTSNLYLLTKEPHLEVTRDELAMNIRRLLSEMPNHAATEHERRLTEQATNSVSQYFRERAQIEATGRSTPEVIQVTRRSLNEALHNLERLRKHNELQVRQDIDAAARVAALGEGVGVVSLVMVVAASLLAMSAADRGLRRPLLDLREAIARFKRGEVQTRAEPDGVREVAEIARGFNQMAASLARQRDVQLEFLAGVAHDLRNPLSAMKLGLGRLGAVSSDAERSSIRERLERQVDRLTRLIGDLLDATQIEAGHLELHREAFDVRQVIDDMVALYAPTSPGHLIVRCLPTTPVVIVGDPVRIEQVVSNLLSNAIKFSPAGGRITVALEVTNGDAVLGVSDEGIGISPEDQEEIFLPFRRRRPEVAPGAGLGLSVVRRILDAHDAELHLESAVGSGTTFSIRLRRLGEGSCAPSQGAVRAPRPSP